MTYERSAAVPPHSGRTPKRPVSAALGALFSVLTCAAWSALTITCLVRAVVDAELGLLFAVGALALVVYALVLPPRGPFTALLRWLGMGTPAGQRLAIAIVIAPVAVLAFVFGVEPGRLLAGILWIVLGLVIASFALLAGMHVTARSRAENDSPMMVAGPGLFAGAISTLFTLGVVFGDDPWSPWMTFGFVLAALGVIADGLWALPSARDYAGSTAATSRP